MKLFSSLFLSLAICATSAFASIHPGGPCGWAVQGEWLFLQPSASEFQFLTFTGDPEHLRREENNPTFKSGFRLEGIYGFDCFNDVHLRFTYYDQSHRRSVVGPQISPFFGADGLSESNLNFRFYEIEALWGRWLFNCGNFNFCFLGGLEYANVRVRNNLHYQAVSTGLDITRFERNFFSGIGPEIVFDLTYPFPSCWLGNFAIALDARGALLASRQKFRRTTTGFSPTPTDTSLDTQPLWFVTPTADMRLGVNWTAKCSFFSVLVETGYEWIWFRKGIRYAEPSSTTPHFGDVDFQGPYVALGVAF